MYTFVIVSVLTCILIMTVKFYMDQVIIVFRKSKSQIPTLYKFTYGQPVLSDVKFILWIL
jgi:hypothetical protein